MIDSLIIFVLLQVTCTMIKSFTKFVFNIMVLLSQSIIACVSSAIIEKYQEWNITTGIMDFSSLITSLRYQKKLTSQYHIIKHLSHCSISINMKQNKQQLVFW